MQNTEELGLINMAYPEFVKEPAEMYCIDEWDRDCYPQQFSISKHTGELGYLENDKDHGAFEAVIGTKYKIYSYKVSCFYTLEEAQNTIREYVAEEIATLKEEYDKYMSEFNQKYLSLIKSYNSVTSEIINNE